MCVSEWVSGGGSEGLSGGCHRVCRVAMSVGTM